MQLLPVSSIIISADRQRKEFDPVALVELCNTIKDKGLMHAVVVRETPEGMVLVAGERRLRAMTDLWAFGSTFRYNGAEIPEGSVPFVTLGQLSPLQAEEAELEENLHRKDLTWQENAAATAKLFRIRSAQAQAEGRLYTHADTAIELKGRGDGSYREAVRKDLIVARHLDNPEVAKAKTTDEAFKILKRQEVSRNNIAHAQVVGSTFSTAQHKLHNVNCIEWMRAADPELFDVILTDPPYGMGADSFGDGGGNRLSNNTHQYKDDLTTWRALMQQWCPLSYRIAKREAHAYVFCDLDNFHELKSMMQDAGWYVFRTPMVCTKPNSGRVPLPTEGPRRQYELILYAIKGHKNTTAIYPDVITTYADPGLQHGAQKPVALFSNLLQRSVRAGDAVLDCFAGSGTIFPACTEHKCTATGLELSQEYYGICLGRLKETGVPQGTPDALSAELQSLLAKGN